MKRTTDVRERLVELLKQMGKREREEGGVTWYDVADHLIAHGVTAEEWKPLEEFLHPIDAHEGLKAKYLVFKADTGKKVDNCFILRPDKDPVAVEALRAYANASDNETLAEDIYNWVGGKGEPVQEWISVKDRLPEKDGQYLIFTTQYFTPDHIDEIDHRDGIEISGYYSGFGFLSTNGIYAKCWCMLPQPPKENDYERP